MGKQTDMQRLQRFLRGQPDHRAGKSAIHAALGWSPDKLARVLERACADGTNSNVTLAPGGRSVRYRGSEIGSRNSVGIYGDVGKAVADDRARQLLGWRAAEVFHTSRGPSHGVWSSPDLVIAAHPRRRAKATDRKLLHAVEVETRKGFDVRSIYQAHAQGRGADFAWVFTFVDALTGGEGQLLERVAWTAECLGVGIVGFERPTNRSTYQVLIRARRFEPSPTEHYRFVQRVMSGHLTTRSEPSEPLSSVS